MPFIFILHFYCCNLVIKISTVSILPQWFKYLTTEIFILPCTISKMSTQYSSSKKENPLLKFDFGTTPFDGDECQAHQFIPFLFLLLQGQLGNHQLSYILDQEHYPIPQSANTPFFLKNNTSNSRPERKLNMKITLQHTNMQCICT